MMASFGPDTKIQIDFADGTSVCGLGFVEEMSQEQQIESVVADGMNVLKPSKSTEIRASFRMMSEMTLSAGSDSLFVSQDETEACIHAARKLPLAILAELIKEQLQQRASKKKVVLPTAGQIMEIERQKIR